MTNRWLERALIASPHLTLCLSAKAFKKACKHVHFPKPYPFWLPDDADAVVHSLEDGSTKPSITIVCIEPLPRRVSDVSSILAHEAVHVYEVVKSQNPSIQWNEEELAAHSIGLITARLIEDYLRQVGRKDSIKAIRRGR